MWTDKQSGSSQNMVNNGVIKWTSQIHHRIVDEIQIVGNQSLWNSLLYGKGSGRVTCFTQSSVPGLEVIKHEYSLRLKIKLNDLLLADTCPQAANHCALLWVWGWTKVL